MIKKITVKDVASYNGDPEVIDGLTKFCFIYGSNGSGKTTISRIIQDCGKNPTCSIDWVNGVPLQPLVYNRDFVDKSLNQPDGIPGVFTLGEDQGDILKRIGSLEGEKTKVETFLNKCKTCLNGQDGCSGIVGNLHELEEQLKEDCWNQKIKHDETFTKIFEGFRGSKELFKKQVLSNLGNKSTLDTYDSLVDRYQKVFKDDLVIESEMSLLDSNEVQKMQIDPILALVIVGRKDIDIAGLIEKLNASDWVREGYTKYFTANTSICPFCQQQTSEKIAQSLQDYFDETYTNNLNKLREFWQYYKDQTQTLIQNARDILDNNGKRIQTDRLSQILQLLEVDVKINLQLIENKIEEPSKQIDLKPICGQIDEINALISAGNLQIIEHNSIIANIEIERKTLKEQVWKYIVSRELDSVIKAYSREKAKYDKAVNGLTIKIKEAQKQESDIIGQIKELRKQTTSIQPTINAINAVLTSLGFSGFRIDRTASGDLYRIVRSNNPDARSTLSEGETSFVTFLYFYCLINGTLSESSNVDDRVIVFDDPVSSLDNDVLFVVSSLIRKVINDAALDSSKAKQVIVLTHNVYFYRQVTYRKHKDKVSGNDVSYWIVKKERTGSRLHRFNDNPIKSSYQLLWDEYKQSSSNSHILPNVMRRILESYFSLLGDIPLDNISDNFEGHKKQICESLLSWVHAGSHNVFDDAFYDVTDETVSIYKEVFKEIFKKTDHEAHYEMMMGPDEVCS